MIIFWLSTDIAGKFLLFFFPLNDTLDEMSEYFGAVLLIFISVHMICLIWLENTLKQDLRLGENLEKILKYASNQIFWAHYLIILHYYFYFLLIKQAFLWS